MTILYGKLWSSKILKQRINACTGNIFFLMNKVIVNITIDGILDSLKYDKRILWDSTNKTHDLLIMENKGERWLLSSWYAQMVEW